MLESVLLTSARQWVLVMFWVRTGSSVAPMAPLLSPSFLLSDFSPWEKLTGQQLPNTNASSFNARLGLGWSPGFKGPRFEVPSGLLHTNLQGSEVPSPFRASLGPHLPCIILQAYLLANKPRMALKVLLISSAARRLFSQFLPHH